MMIKTLGLLIMAAVMIVMLLAVALMVYHNVQLKKEVALYPPPGKLVEVNGKKIHVFTVLGRR